MNLQFLVYRSVLSAVSQLYYKILRQCPYPYPAGYTHPKAHSPRAASLSPGGRLFVSSIISQIGRENKFSAEILCACHFSAKNAERSLSASVKAFFVYSFSAGSSADSSTAVFFLRLFFVISRFTSFLLLSLGLLIPRPRENATCAGTPIKNSDQRLASVYTINIR